MPVLKLTARLAREVKQRVEAALADGCPPPGGVLWGQHRISAIRRAADEMDLEQQTLRGWAGSPGRAGRMARFQLAVDWSLYRPNDTFSVISEEQAGEAAEAYKKTGSKARAAADLHISFETLQRRLARAAELGLFVKDPPPPSMPGFVVARTSTTLDGEGNVRATSIQQKREPGDEFAMPPGQTLKGVSALVDPEGRVIQQWVKTKQDSVTAELIEALKRTFAGYTGHAPLIPPPARTDADLLSIYPIADQHHGLLAWGKETGEDYDLRIGAARLRSSMARLVTQSPASREAIILNLGDWQHTDDARNVTPRSGYVLDVDSRFFKILTTGVQLMQDCIELALQKHEAVTVRNIPGNHDPHASVALTVALSAFYSANPRVTIDASPSEWFFRRFGASLIGATHGHRVKADRMAMAMAVMCREDWGETKYHYIYHGHIHHETVKEVGDVRVESFQSLAANDAHHAAGGYVAGKSLTSITHHVADGEVGRHKVHVPPPPSPLRVAAGRADRPRTSKRRRR